MLFKLGVAFGVVLALLAVARGDARTGLVGAGLAVVFGLAVYFDGRDGR